MFIWFKLCTMVRSSLPEALFFSVVEENCAVFRGPTVNCLRDQKGLFSKFRIVKKTSSNKKLFSAGVKKPPEKCLFV